MANVCDSSTKKKNSGSVTQNLFVFRGAVFRILVRGTQKILIIYMHQMIHINFTRATRFAPKSSEPHSLLNIVNEWMVLRCCTCFVTCIQPAIQPAMRAGVNDECYIKVFWKNVMRLNHLYRIFGFILLIKSNLMKYAGCYSVITLSIFHKP